jgi:MerR family copper efflux transcriptional regulator
MGSHWKIEGGDRIETLAARCGVSTRTVRAYEREGLLPVPRRAASGRRLYDGDVLVRLQFICRALAIGLSLEDVRDLLSSGDRKRPLEGQRTSRGPRARADAIDEEIAKLRVYRLLLDEESGSVRLLTRARIPDAIAVYSGAVRGTAGARGTVPIHRGLR